MIRILTDSTADLGAQFAQELGVAVVPLLVNFGDTQYRDGLDLPLPKFYEMLVNSKKLPTTSQPSPEVFETHFSAAKAAGDTIICVLLSSAISGTCQSAQIACDLVGYENIHIVDSKNATLALGLLVRRAVDDVNKGMSAQEIVLDLVSARARLHLIAIVDDLSYLRKGGRLSSATAFAGGLLGIKPVLAIDAEGKLGLYDKARGMPGAYVALFKGIEKFGGIDESSRVVVGYTGHRQGADPFVRYVTNNLKRQPPEVYPIGTVIGTHAGPGACGIAFFANEQ